MNNAATIIVYCMVGLACLPPEDGDTEAQLKKAAELVDAKQYRKAIEIYDRVVSANPRGEAGYRGRLIVWFQQAKWEKMVDECNEMLRQCPLVGQRALCLTDRAYGNYKLGKFQQALDDLEMALRLHHGAYRALELAVWIKATCPDNTLKSGADAMALAKDLSTRDPDDDLTFQAKAAALAAVGRFEDAVEAQKKALKACAERRRLQNQLLLKCFMSSKPFVDEDRIF